VGQPAADSPRPPIGRENVLGGTLLGIPASLLFLYLATRGLDPDDVASSLRRAAPAWVALAVPCMGLLYAFQAARWRRIGAAAGVELPFRSYAAMVICGVAANNVVPGRPGELLRGYWLARASGAPGARALSTVVVDRLADVLLLVSALAASYPFVPHPQWLRRFFIIALPLAAAVALFLLGCRFYVRHRERGGRPPLRVLRSRWLGRQLARMVRGTAASVNGRDAVAIALLSALAWGAFALGAWLVARGLGIEITPIQLVLVTGVVNLGASLPSSPGSIGWYQWLCVAALGLLGVGAARAFAFSVLLQATWFVPTTLGGLVFLGRGAGRFGRERLRRPIRLSPGPGEAFAPGNEGRRASRDAAARPGTRGAGVAPPDG
jgi:uncharacterized protein (TIRG00374 family)